MLLCVFWLQGFLAEAKDSEEFGPTDRWYEVFLGNSKVGFAHSTMKLKNGEVLSESIFEMKIKRAGQVIEMKVVERTRETIEGQMLAFQERCSWWNSHHQGRMGGEGRNRGEGKTIFQRNDEEVSLDPKGKMTWDCLNSFARGNSGNRIKLTRSLFIRLTLEWPSPPRQSSEQKGPGKSPWEGRKPLPSKQKSSL